MYFSKQLHPKWGILFSLIFFIIGIVILLFGYKESEKYNEKSKKYIQIDAYVVDYAYSESDEGNTTKAIIVEYEVDGKTYRKQSSVYTSNPKSIESVEKIKYNPENPEDIIFEKNETSFVLYLVGAVFTFVGLLLTIIFAIVTKKIDENNDMLDQIAY